MSFVEIVALTFAVILVGATLQRVSDMGVGLLAGPAMSVALGPVTGIVVVNALAAFNAFIGAVSVRRHIEWSKVAVIGSVMVFGSIPAAMLITQVSTAVLQMVVGVVLLWALFTALFAHGRIPQAHGRAPAVISGVAAGFMNTVAGVAGPAITVYALASRWPQVPYAASLQPLFVISALTSLAVKGAMGTITLDGVPWGVWPAGAIAAVLGIAMGSVLSDKVDRASARKLAITLAMIGALVVVVRGVVGLL